MSIHIGHELDDLTRDRGYWYLATVYSKWQNGIDDAWDFALHIAGRLIMRGVPTYSPIAHNHSIGMAMGVPPGSHDIWMPVDKPMFDGASGLLVVDMPGWHESIGVTEEIRWSREAKKPAWLLAPISLRFRAL